MGLSVKERGEAVATFRHVHVEMMEMLAQWTPSAPEMEAKLLFGEHIWDAAQHADQLGKRAHELRLPPQHSLPPAPEYAQLLAAVRAERDTARRLAAFYDALLPGLARRYRDYLARTDVLMDAPTVRILEQMLERESRMVEQSRELRATLPALAGADRAWVDALVRRESQVANLVGAAGS
jgi:1,2-phenylacetyl-CoA epoxidase catalytic subunit